MESIRSNRLWSAKLVYQTRAMQNFHDKSLNNDTHRSFIYLNIFFEIATGFQLSLLIPQHCNLNDGLAKFC